MYLQNATNLNELSPEEELSPLMRKTLEAMDVCQEIVESGDMTEEEIITLIDMARKEKQVKDDVIRYTIAKQIPRMEFIHTPYGSIDLDPEMVEAVQEALERVLYSRIDERPPVDTMVVELAECQREELDKMSDQTGKIDDSLVQLAFEFGFEPMNYMARLIKR